MKSFTASASASAPVAAAAPVKSNPPARELDLLIGYTPAAMATLGSDSLMINEIRRMVQYANGVFKNSGTTLNLRLVRVQALTTNESDDFIKDLAAARLKDGTWDELLTLRDRFHADLVSVVVAGTEGGSTCGRGFKNGVTSPIAEAKDFMFSIVSISPFCFRDVLAHEVGHNLGSDHEPENASGGVFSFSIAQDFTGQSGEGWRTMMSNSSNRGIPFFSTPRRVFDRRAVGSADADNARSLQTTAPLVAKVFSSLKVDDKAAKLLPTAISVSARLIRSATNVAVRIQVRSKSGFLYYEPLTLYSKAAGELQSRLSAVGRSDATGRFLVDMGDNNFNDTKFFACAESFLSPAKPLCTQPFEINFK